MEGLTEGRMVHFVLNDHTHRPAVVVEVQNNRDGLVELFVMLALNDTADADRSMNAFNVQYDSTFRVGTWHWIERA